MKISISLFGLLTLMAHAFSNNVLSDENGIIVRLKNPQNTKLLHNQFPLLRTEMTEPLIAELGLYLVRATNSRSTDSMITALNRTDGVMYAHRDHKVTLRSVTPNDPQFSEQWNFFSLSNSADIGATLAWDMGVGGVDARGHEIVVAVIDDGLDISHGDISPNIWINHHEIPGNNVDDDNNGYIDDINGWNAFTNKPQIPKGYHGTHIAGIVGAAGNNHSQVTGVNWKVKIMPIVGASELASVVTKAYGYAMAQKRIWIATGGERGANIVASNSSFGVNYADCTSPQFRVWNDLYDAMGELGILSAAAAPNAEINIDKEGDIPTSCPSQYIISVTNTTQNSDKFKAAGFGKTHIDLGAPGTDILSTVPDNRTGKLTGCSMSTPHIAGAVALMHSIGSTAYNDLYMRDQKKAALVIKSIMLETVDPIAALKDQSVSGGKLNLYRAASEIRRYTE